MVNVRKAGADAGNDSLKLIVSDAAPITIPMVYSNYMKSTSSEFMSEDIPVSDLLDNLDVTINSSALSRNGGRYIIGNRVYEDLNTPIELEENSSKHTDQIPVLVTLAGLAAAAIEKEPTKNKISASFDLGVALPISAIDKETAEANIERFTGLHEVIFHHPSGRDVKVALTIEYCKCLPEGAAAAWGIVYDASGKVAKRKVEINDKVENVDLTDKTLLHFDIGSGTTEIVVTEGVKFLPRLSEGSPIGVKNTIAKIRKNWNSDYPMKRIESTSEFNQIYLDPEHPRHNAVVQASETPLNTLAQRLSTEMINKIDTLKDDPFIFIYGGGASLVKSELQKILNEKNRTTNVTFLSDSVFANANGLYVYTCSPRFEQQKEHALGVGIDGEKA